MIEYTCDFKNAEVREQNSRNPSDAKSDSKPKILVNNNIRKVKMIKKRKVKIPISYKICNGPTLKDVS